MDSRLRGNDGRFYGRFGLSGALIIKPRLPCGIGSMGDAVSEGIHAETKPAKGPHSRPVAQHHRGTIVETSCERHKPPPMMVAPVVYRCWAEAGYTAEIFYEDCVTEAEE